MARRIALARVGWCCGIWLLCSIIERASETSRAHELSKGFAMHGRTFGKSLCRAWSSGSAALVPGIVMEIRPVRDGWKEFAAEPHLGGLEWAVAAVPTPDGVIEVESDSAGTSIKIPAGLALMWQGQKFAGPALRKFDND